MTYEEEIKRLKNAVEDKVGRKPVNPTDFNFIAMQIMKETKDNISVSTLKRLWGYVEYKSKPSKTTLSILVRFLGFPDWQSFLCANDGSNYVESEDLSDKVVNASNLCIGDIVEIEWRPNRYCKMKCIGTKLFKVLEAHNCKLFPGNVFHAEMFGKGHPFYVTNLQQSFNEGRIYVAGTCHGLTSVKIY